MVDNLHLATCVPFAVSKVLGISQEEAGELLLAEHNVQFDASDGRFLGNPTQGYHHNVMEKVLEARGFAMVWIPASNRRILSRWRGGKRKISSTEPAEIGQCLIRGSDTMVYFRDLQRRWSIQKKEPGNSIE
jgi:hypothetical protein